MSPGVRHNNPFYASIDDVLSIGSAQKRCLQMGRVCDVMEIPQSRLATATSRPPARDIRDTVNPPRGFDQSAMLTSYRVWDYVSNANCLSRHGTWNSLDLVLSMLPAAQ